MTTPTPRTNAAIDKWVSRGDMRIVLDHARQLERELAAAQKRNTQLVKALDDMYGTPCEQIRHQQELQSAQEARQRAEKERTEHLEWRTKLANDLDECERMRDVLARTVNVLDAENKELRSAETVAWMICEPECKYGPTFGTENAAWSALTKAPPGSELVELVKR